jgi:hypothetical protein
MDDESPLVGRRRAGLARHSGGLQHRIVKWPGEGQSSSINLTSVRNRLRNYAEESNLERIDYYSRYTTHRIATER